MAENCFLLHLIFYACSFIITIIMITCPMMVYPELQLRLTSLVCGHCGLTALANNGHLGMLLAMDCRMKPTNRAGNVKF